MGRKFCVNLLWNFLFFIFFAEAKSVTDPSPSVDEEIVFFTPPIGWLLAEANALPPSVKTMVIGKDLSTFPPSLNLSWQPYKGTLRQYLKIIKNINSAQGYEWKDLGTIKTAVGTASLSQVDTKAQWGDIRLMHVVLLKNQQIYILTASALKNEFSRFYQDFFTAMKSLKVVNDVEEMIIDSAQRNQLKQEANAVQRQWEKLILEKQKDNPQIAWIDLRETIFNSQEFQKKIWNPFQEKLQQQHHSLGTEWQSLFLKKLQNSLFNMNPKTDNLQIEK